MQPTCNLLLFYQRSIFKKLNFKACILIDKTINIMARNEASISKAKRKKLNSNIKFVKLRKKLQRFSLDNRKNMFF